MGDDEATRVWAAWVRRALSDLPAQQASALRLVYFDHMAFRDAAGQLGLSLQEVQRVVADGLGDLGRLLSCDCGGVVQ